MSNHNKLNDEQLKQLISEFKSNIEVPEPSNFNRVHAQIVNQAKTKSRWLMIRQAASIGVAAILISFLITNNSSQVSAQFTNFFKVIQNEVTQIFLTESNTEQQATTNTSNSNDKTNILSNNEQFIAILTEIDFTPPLPKYIPNGFIVDEVSITEFNGGKLIRINLYNDLNQYFTLNYQNVEDQYTFVRDPELNNTQYEDISIGEYVGVFVFSENTGYTVDWIDKYQIKATISTNVNKIELMKIINSIY